MPDHSLLSKAALTQLRCCASAPEHFIPVVRGLEPAEVSDLARHRLLIQCNHLVRLAPEGARLLRRLDSQSNPASSSHGQ